MKTMTLVRSAVALVAAMGFAAVACGSDGAEDATTACIDENEQTPRFRVTLVTVWNGTPELLPEGIGVTEDCTRPVHTIGRSVYVVGEQERTVGDLFDLWPDNPSTRANATLESVSLNGVRYEDDYRGIVFEDGQRIVVAFDNRPS